MVHESQQVVNVLSISQILDFFVFPLVLFSSISGRRHIFPSFLSCSTMAMLCASARFFFAPYNQVPLQKDVKVNWVRPGQVVHESQQVEYIQYAGDEMNIPLRKLENSPKISSPFLVRCCAMSN